MKGAEKLVQLAKSGVKKFGWIPDRPDARDRKFSFSTPPVAIPLPSLVDWSEQCGTAYDQLSLGSCVANSVCELMRFNAFSQGNKECDPSRLFLYYVARDLAYTSALDCGSTIRDAIKGVAKIGVCSEQDWPYDVLKFAKKPQKSAYSSAEKFQAIAYERVGPSLEDMKLCLATGRPFSFGFTVYDSFLDKSWHPSGMMPTPSLSEADHGGHAVLAVGYSDEKQCFLIRNSWGSDWGLAGNFWMPYSVISNENLCDDRWTIFSVE